MTDNDPGINIILDQAERALSSGDRRTAGILINRVLLLDFPNEAAWRLLQRLAGSSQPLQDFQVEFTSKYYPDKLHLLAVQGPDWLDAMEEEPQTPANPAPGPAPVVHSAMPPAPSARAMPAPEPARHAPANLPPQTAPAARREFAKSFLWTCGVLALAVLLLTVLLYFILRGLGVPGISLAREVPTQVGSMPTPVMSSSGGDQPTPVPAASQNCQIAFMSGEGSGNAIDMDVFIMDADGSNVRQLTSTGGYKDAPPVWSPDGSRIAFVRSGEALTTPHNTDSQIFVMAADGSNLRPLTANGLLNILPTWSPDGSRIAYSASNDNGFYQILVVQADGGDPQQLTSSTTSAAMPAWSPDGRSIVFFGSDQSVLGIYAIDVNGSNLHLLTPANNQMLMFPNWSPDGRQVAYIASDSATPGMQVMVMNADGGDVHQLASGGFNGSVNPALPFWSPDGSRLTFLSGLSDGNGDVSVINADGSGLRTLTSGSGQDFVDPVWSPDGNRIAFTSISQGEIYVINADGSDLHMINPLGGFPAWSPGCR